MKKGLPDYTRYRAPRQQTIDWLRANNVNIWSMIRPYPILLAVGQVTPEPERFVESPSGVEWLVFVEETDVIYWHLKSGQLVAWNGRAFALGEANIVNAGTYALGVCLEIHAGPLDWLRNGRKGIVVLDWSQAFDRLRDCPRIKLPASLEANYRRHMKPTRLPVVTIVRADEEMIA